MKKPEKEKAKKMRRQGHSLGEISKSLGVSKSTASLWTKNEVISAEGKKHIAKRTMISRTKGHEILRAKKLIRIDTSNKEAEILINKLELNKNISMTALSIMYWCEGAKNDNHIAFTNSDPDLVKAFIKILFEIFNIDKSKLRANLQLHDYHNETQMLDFWSQSLGLVRSNFTKTYIKKSNHKYSNKGYKGCIRITYYNSHIARVLLSFAKKFIKLYI